MPTTRKKRLTTKKATTNRPMAKKPMAKAKAAKPKTPKKKNSAAKSKPKKKQKRRDLSGTGKPVIAAGDLAIIGTTDRGIIALPEHLTQPDSGVAQMRGVDLVP
jgi:hypothetical protein